ncbi:thiol:disulfide interchange protein [Helicobacter pylori]|uniref:SoxW family protein n=1 Tax=Helicobacter pylori TaxID=210 RepID=UPI0009948599|nr:thioredoxin fold domain-containing protein [Helicobacter pylori]OOQ04867.1 thiol:disulfide interchange protein [Helicobacter pylori]PDW73857.1 thiol:disulfide interchange protein [Helicobacter pylori]
MFSLSYVSKKFLSVLLLVSLFLSACKSNNKDKLDENLLSSGSQSSKELNDERDNIDKKSYAGLEDIFSDNKSISPNDKYMLLVFGRNGCHYCERLKKDLKNVKELSDYIKEHFSTYYVNISYSKEHNFKVGDKDKNDEKEIKMSTEELAQIYAVQSTPTIVLSDKTGKTIYELPGYMPSTQFLAVLEFIGDGKYQDTKNDEDFTKKLKAYIKYKTNLSKSKSS